MHPHLLLSFHATVEIRASVTFTPRRVYVASAGGDPPGLAPAARFYQNRALAAFWRMQLLHFFSRVGPRPA